MISGRILIVSDRREVIAELEPVIRAGQHVASVVPDGAEAMELMAEGVVPDVVISDLGSERACEGIGYVHRFRQLNRTGAHIVVTEPGAPFGGGASTGADRFSVLPRPFGPEQVRTTLDEAVRRVEEDVRTLRADVWRSMDALRREVQDARSEMVQALALTIAARDHYMRGHCERVAEMCGRMGVALHVSGDDLDMLAQSARLHEIGKISVPVELLQKTEPLTTDELRCIRSHPAVGGEIMRGVPSLRRLAVIVEHQGTDYRDLAEHVPASAPENLLIGILRVADVWDAMTSERSYRGALGRAEWEAVLTAGAGTRYHPEAVWALLRVVGSAA